MRSTSTLRPARTSPPVVVASSALIDAALVISFAVMGRNSHDREATLAGLWETSWPFLSGLALTWLVIGAWRRPVEPLRSGLPLAAGTLVFGFVLRRIAGQGTALPFILVATGTLILLLASWRLVSTMIAAARRRAPAEPTSESIAHEVNSGGAAGN